MSHQLLIILFWVDFTLSLKIMLLSLAWYGKPYWKYLNARHCTREGLITPSIRTVTTQTNALFYLFLSNIFGWLVGCFGFNGPLRQYFSLYRAVSQREGERGERIDGSKNVQTAPTRTYGKRNRPLPYCNQNCRTPRHWKFTQDHRTTRPPPKVFGLSSNEEVKYRNVRLSHLIW